MEWFNPFEGSVKTDSQITPESKNPPSSEAVYDYVNEAISTNTANFIGTFDSVFELNAYSGQVSNNDYAFVVREYDLLKEEPSDWSSNFNNYYTKTTGAPQWESNKYYEKSGNNYTLTISQPNDWDNNYSNYYTIYNTDQYINVVGVDSFANVTGIIAPTFTQDTYYEKSTTYYDRYKYNSNNEEWGFEYSLEFTKLTPEQWAAINSGMTANDKTKLNGIEDNANNYSLPAATTSTLGGVIVGDSLAVENNGTVLFDPPIMTLQEYQALQTKSAPLYFIYEEE